MMRHGLDIPCDLAEVHSALAQGVWTAAKCGHILVLSCQSMLATSQVYQLTKMRHWLEQKHHGWQGLTPSPYVELSDVPHHPTAQLYRQQMLGEAAPSRKYHSKKVQVSLE